MLTWLSLVIVQIDTSPPPKTVLRAYATVHLHRDDEEEDLGIEAAKSVASGYHLNGPSWNHLGGSQVETTNYTEIEVRDDSSMKLSVC